MTSIASEVAGLPVKPHVPKDATSTSGCPAPSSVRRNNTSAMGDLQMFPVQTMRIFIAST